MDNIVTKNKMTLDVSPDKLRCYLVFEPDGEYKDVTDLDIIELLKKHNIVITERVRELIQSAVAELSRGASPQEPILIAEGTAPVYPVDQRFEWADELTHHENIPENETVNFYQQTRLTLVEKGMVLGKIVHGREGKEGVDVYGNPIKIRIRPVEVKLGENVELAEDNETVKATAAGQAFYERNKVYVRDVLEIKGNVDFETGNIEAGSDVLIRGLVKDLFIVRSKKNISVAKLVESAYLFADGNITIAGGVKGRGKARLEAGGNIAARFIEYTYVESAGDVIIGNEVIDSIIICKGMLKVERGALIGGQSYAFRGAVVKNLGSSSGVKTIIGIASDPFVLSEVVQLERKIEEIRPKIEKIRTTVAPLLQQIKRLTPEQREKATELMFTADNLEIECQKYAERIDELKSQIPEPGSAELVVFSTVYPNTEIIINNRVTVIKQELKGPVKITLRRVKGVTEMVQINQLTGSVYTLKSHKLPYEEIKVPPKPPIAQPGAGHSD